MIGQQSWEGGFSVAAEWGGQSCMSPILPQVKYRLVYTAAGQIQEAGLSLVLGTLNSTVSLLQQKFEILFIQVSVRVVFGWQVEESSKLTWGQSV